MPKISKSRLYRRMGIIFLVVLLLLVILWIGGFIYANDFSVTTQKNLPSGVQTILVVFPHADDEALTSGGFVSGLSKSGKEVYWMVLTKGEKGNPEGKPDEKLKEVRANEARRAARVYGIENLILKDYPDGSLSEQREQVEQELINAINDIKPDLVITYDLAGLYGHPDHMVTSEVVTDIVKAKSNIMLWYVSYPKRILDTVSLPDHMARDSSFKTRRVYPTHKVWVGVGGVMNKIKAVYSYTSQRESYISSFPIKFIPLWFYISLTPYEYFHEILG